MKPLTPLEVYNAKNRDEHLAAQAKFLRNNRRGTVPRLTDAKPDVVQEADGGLRIRCECRDYPLVDPRTRTACCFNCGLIYDDLTIPEGGA